MQVRLHDVLAYLSSPRGRDTVIALRDQLERDGADLHTVRMDPPGPNEPLPTDVFERGVTQYLYDSFFAPQDLALAMPAAVTATLAAAADSKGMLDTAKVGRLLGAQAKTLLATVAARTTSGADSSALEAQTMTLLDVRTRGLVAASAPAIAANRALYDDVTRRFGRGISLQRFECFAIGEIQPQTQELVRALGRAGLPAAKTHWLSDPQRTHAVEVERLRARGVDVPRYTDDGGVSDASIGAMLSAMFANVRPGETQPRFLLIDENGRITRYLHRFFPQYAPLCVIVEQRAPASSFSDVTLRAPVVSIDGSSADPRRYAVAGERTVSAIERQLRRATPTFVMSPKEAVVEGYSPRSQGIIAALRQRGYSVFVATEDPTELAAARAAGLSADSLAAQLPHARLLIPTTGTMRLGIPELTNMPRGGVIASAAPTELAGRPPSGPVDRSVTIDDNGVLRSTFLGRPIELGRTFDWFQHRVIHMSAGDDRLLLRAGTDVALDTELTGTAAQLDGALTLGAVYDAVRAKTPTATTLTSVP